MIKDKRTASVYWIRNDVTNKCYIGSTANGVISRWNGHLKMLNEGRHSKPFQEAWDETDISQWSFKIVETGIPLHLRDEAEAKWINECGNLNIATPSARQIKEEKIREVLSMVKEGKTYRQVSEQCGVALGTVASWVKRYDL